MTFQSYLSVFSILILQSALVLSAGHLIEIEFPTADKCQCHCFNMRATSHIAQYLDIALLWCL